MGRRWYYDTFLGCYFEFNGKTWEREGNDQ